MISIKDWTEQDLDFCMTQWASNKDMQKLLDGLRMGTIWSDGIEVCVQVLLHGCECFWPMADGFSGRHARFLKLY